jgi:hypothetical protein
MLDQNQKRKTLTDLEKKVIKNFETADQYGDDPYMHFDDISACTEIPARQLRGVISSLAKKLCIQEFDCEYLKGSFYLFLAYWEDDVNPYFKAVAQGPYYEITFPE